MVIHTDGFMKLAQIPFSFSISTSLHFALVFVLWWLYIVRLEFISPDLKHLEYSSYMAFVVEEEAFLGYDSFDLFQMSAFGTDEMCHTGTSTNYKENLKGLNEK